MTTHPPVAEPAPDASVPERLLSSATSLFAKQGFERTSVQQIVSAAGLTKGAMYHYFGSKDELLADTYRRVLDVQIDRLTELVEADGPLEDRLRSAVEAVVRSVLENLEHAIVVGRSIHLLEQPARDAMRVRRDRCRELFLALLDEGLQRGAVRDDVPLDLVAYNFFGAILYLPVWYARGTSLSVDTVASSYATMLLDGLLAPAP